LYETPDSFLLLKRDFNLKESIQSGPLKAILEEEPEDLIFAFQKMISQYACHCNINIEMIEHGGLGENSSE
jgi:hypothetical protein